MNPLDDDAGEQIAEGDDLIPDDRAEGPVRGKRSPIEPSAEERARHETTHVVYRSWCRACVAGRGRVDKHSSSEVDLGEGGSDPRVPVIGMDYGYFNDKADDTSGTPFLATRNSYDKWTAGICLPCTYIEGVSPEAKAKGASNLYAVQSMLAVINAAGHNQVILRSDQEPSILALKAEVIRRAREELGCTVLPEEAPKGDSASNGLAELAVREIKGVARTLKFAAEEKHGTVLAPDHPALAFMVHYAGKVISLNQVGADGRTGYERRKGRRYKRELPWWSEKVLFMPKTPKARSTAAPKYIPGIFLGLVDRSDEVIIGNADGVFHARSFRRLPPSEAHDAELLQSIKGLPWDLTRKTVGRRADEIPLRIVANPVTRAQDLPVPLPEPEVKRKRVYIRADVELQKYGYTPQCAGCDAAKTGEIPARPHSEACRSRITRAMEQDEAGQVRITEAIMRGGEKALPSEISHADLPTTPTTTLDLEAPPTTATAPASSSSAGPSVEGPSASTRLSQALRRPADPLLRDDGAKRLNIRGSSSTSIPMLPKGTKRVPASSPEDLEGETGDPKGGVAPPNDPPAIGGASSSDVIMDNSRAMGSLNLLSAMFGDAQADVSEVFSPGIFTDRAPTFNLKPGLAMDLRVGWDFTKESDRRRAREHVVTAKPLFLVGSPVCTAFSSLQNLNPKTPQYFEKFREGLQHLRFCVDLYWLQLRENRWFVHEHPRNATSWKVDAIKKLSEAASVQTVDCDQCRFGHCSEDEHGIGLVQKPTRWLTNSVHMARMLDKKCLNRTQPDHHRHVHLVSGRAKAAERYPPRLVEAMLRAMRQELLSAGMISTLDAHTHTHTLRRAGASYSGAGMVPEDSRRHDRSSFGSFCCCIFEAERDGLHEDAQSLGLRHGGQLRCGNR